MKKLTTRLLSLVLLGAFIPSFALAQEWDLNNGNIIVNAVPGTEQTVSQAGSTPTVDNNPVITSSGTTINTVTITAAENATANVTLENVDIDTSATGKAAITTSGQGNVNIELDGTNTVQSGTYHAGVEKKDNGTLTITDENKNGSLTANGGQWAAGIGGGENGNGSRITIEGGTVTANGGKCGAGIGGGSNDNNVENIGKGEDIIIKDGTVTATGGGGAAGIGGGYAGAGSGITVSGGTVTATGGNGGAGIGSGNKSSAQYIEVSKGTVKATGGINSAGIGGGGEGFAKNITVSGGKVEAQGGENGAGIGGGYLGSGNEINIEGGTVIATGGDNAAGIGGGNRDFSPEDDRGNGSNITVSGGEVTAIGGAQGAGIGGGNGGNGTGITVSGGDVTATGNGKSDSSGVILNSGAGIGGGAGGSGSQITIENGKVEATGNNYGAGIGGGNGGTGSEIKIEGGNVKAQGGWSGAGIGGGGGKGGNDITVSGGEVTAKGGTLGAGIGGGGEGRDDNSITINGGKVTAQGGGCGAGIGGGFKGTGSVAISGDAQVKAQGGANWIYKEGAAIGNGGTPSQEGAERTFDPSKLTVDGFIHTYKPGDNINTATPNHSTIGTTGEHSWDKGTVTTQPTCTTEGVMTYTCKNPDHGKKTVPIPALNHDFKTYIYDNNATCEADGTETAKCERCDATDTRTAKGSKLTGNTAETAVEARQDAYWVCGTDGQALPYQSQVKDGVLTVTVQADTASLRGTTGSLGQLEAQGIAEIRFVTKGAQSAFTLADLLASGTGSFTLTHEAETVTFTLAEKDISGILK